MALMTTDEEPLYKEESKVLIGCAIEVHNEVGFGFHEKPYENALMIELQRQGISVEQQKHYPLT